MTYEATYTYKHLTRAFRVEAECESDAIKVARAKVAAAITTITLIGDPA